MKIADLRRIRSEHSIESDALEDVLLLWLNREYNVKEHGPPTWRMLVEAVDKKSGGDNHELAKQIALNHPAGREIIWIHKVLTYILIHVPVSNNDSNLIRIHASKFCAC